MSNGNVWYWLLSKPRRGSRHVYYCGFLTRDRDPVVGKFGAQEAISDIAHAAWQAYERGEVLLFQERVATNYYRYIAVKT